MAEQSGFFDAHLIGGEYDRVYLAESFAKYFASFIGNGVFGGKSDELMVQQNTSANMSVNVLSGQGWINGYWYENDNELPLIIDVADGTLNRIDLIVLRWDNSERVIRATVKKGTPASIAYPPAIERNADYYELTLAQIQVNAGTTRITQEQITDMRLDKSACGLVQGVVQQFDTTEFGKQLNSFIENFKIESIAEMEDLLAQVKELISEDAVANLVLEIDGLKSDMLPLKQAVGFTKKNLLPYPYNSSYGKINFRDGVEWFDHGDGTLTILGTTNVGGSRNVLYEGEIPSWMTPGKYILTAEGNTSSFYVIFSKVKKGTTNELVDTVRSFDNPTIEITESDITDYNILIAAIASSEVTFPRTKISPMLRSIDFKDNTWEPFRLSVLEMLQEDKAERGCFYRINYATKIKEWFNPPMKFGVEYCTTERFENKPVYQKAIYLSAMPNASIVQVNAGAAGNRVISVNAFMIDGQTSEHFILPATFKNRTTPSAYISKIGSDGTVEIAATEDLTRMKGYVVLKYTK